jgi:predicted transcriptional regulator
VSKQQEVAKAIASYRDATSEVLTTVIELLEAGRYNDAEQVMVSLSQQQAQVSMKMRSVLVAAGLLKSDDDD